MNGAPIINPVLPYVGPLPSLITPGKFVRVLGVALQGSNTFSINLQCGPDFFDDIALHLLVNAQDQTVILGAQQNSVWQSKRIVECFDILPNQQFEVLLICEPTVYKIGISGKHLCEYPHILPYYSVTHIRIEGNVSISLISVEKQDFSLTVSSERDMSYPPPYPATAPSQPFPPQQNVGYAPYANAPGTTTVYVQDPHMHAPGVNIAAVNATPRPYQPTLWSRSVGWPYGAGNRKVVYIAMGVFGVFFVIFLIVFLIIFTKVSSHF